MISCIIPTYKDEGYLERCVDSVNRSRNLCGEYVEILIIENTPEIGKLNACNLGSRVVMGNTLVFLDADCLVSPNFFPEISMKAKNPYFVGGGVKHIKLERISLGIICAVIPAGLYLMARRVTVGAFWVRDYVFDELGGFIRNSKYYDVDFAVRLKKYAKKHGKKFESLKESHIVWSTRKFDWHGDWHWLRGYKTEELGYN